MKSDFPPIPRLAALVLLSMLLGAIHSLAQGSAEFQTRREWSFAEDKVRFDNRFSGARLNEVRRTGPREYRLSILPEARPINNSPWYAFQVHAGSPEPIRLTLAYRHGNHRYHPKLRSSDGTWKALPKDTVKVRAGRTEASFDLRVPSDGLLVSGQPLITLEDQMEWTRQMARRPGVTQREFGRSVQNRPLVLLETRTAKAPDAPTLLLMTGQHPPETTSIRGFRPFVETLLGDSPLAADFRSEVNLLIMPLLNPDGWYHGHWRCNANGIDPNRAWTKDGLPAVPEIRHAIAALRQVPNPFALLDFHSTKSNVFYTGTDEGEEPTYLVPDFIEALNRRVPDRTWKHDRFHSTGGGVTSRSWTTREFGIPSITWEWADLADERRFRETAPAGAEEWMKRMLDLRRANITAPAVWLDFETAGQPGHNRSGPLHAAAQGTPAFRAPAASGRAALCLAGENSHLTLPDFDYASAGATLSLWFQASHADLSPGPETHLFSHGSPGQPESLSIHFLRASQVLEILLRDANDPADLPPIRIAAAPLLESGAWQHLGLILTPGEGVSAFLNGRLAGSSRAGDDGLNPSGPLHLGVQNDAAPDSRFRGRIDDFRIDKRPLRPYELSILRRAPLAAPQPARLRNP